NQPLLNQRIINLCFESPHLCDGDITGDGSHLASNRGKKRLWRCRGADCESHSSRRVLKIRHKYNARGFAAKIVELQILDDADDLDLPACRLQADVEALAQWVLAWKVEACHALAHHG